MEEKKEETTKSAHSVTEVLIDTSGSVSTDLIKGFLNQLKPLVNKTDLKVGCFDLEFYGFEQIREVNDLDNFKIKGGFGTDINCALNAFTEGDKVNRIVFTDGCFFTEDIKDKEKFKDDKNFTWIIFERPIYGFEAPYGKTIYADSEKIIQKYQQTKQSANNDDEAEMN